MLNRSAVVIRPAQPFIDWVAAHSGPEALPSAEGEQTVYLIPEYEDDVDALDLLAQGFDVIFEMELHSWYTDESVWPKHRSFAMFREWFIIEFHSVVEDLCGFPLEDDSLEG